MRYVSRYSNANSYNNNNSRHVEGNICNHYSEKNNYCKSRYTDENREGYYSNRNNTKNSEGKGGVYKKGRVQIGITIMENLVIKIDVVVIIV